MGGLIFFNSDKEDDVWTKPVKMKSPVNSGGDDFAVIVEKGGTIAKGYKDIFSLTVREAGRCILPVLHETTGIYPQWYTVFNLKNKEVIPDAKLLPLTINDTFRWR
jgi:hypothetical protein